MVRSRLIGGRWAGAWFILAAWVACDVTLPAAEPHGPPLPLRVEKTHIVDSRNERVRLRGVNVASLEWTSDGEGHVLDTVDAAIRDWRVDHVRLPLAQDRWFGKAPEQKDEGRAYRDFVKKVVDACSGQGRYVILDLHWSDAGEWGRRIGQHVMPDRNSVAFWKEVAAAYKDHPAVIFDLYNEPHTVSWQVWRRGGQVTEKDGKTGQATTYEAVGMQELLDTVRATGAKNVVIAGGLDWSYDLGGILKEGPLADPDGNGVVYANHAYPFKGDTVERWVAKMEAATKTLPVIVSEFGSDPKGGAGLSGEQWVRKVLHALEGHEWNWTAWDLHPAAGPCLISDWKYTPTPWFGRWVKQTLAGTPPADPPAPAAPAPAAGAVGMFEGHGDVGEVLHPGAVDFDGAKSTYTVAGSGANMWLATDAFHFVWKPASGDLAMSADVAFLGAGTDPHRKACLMIRQSLDADSAYADVVVHGDGLTSLQFREAKGAATHEVQANVSGPRRLKLVKRGKYVTMFVGAEGEDPKFSGAAERITFAEPFYVGLGVCSHNKDVTEKAVFTNVELTAPLPAASAKPVLYSTLETQSMASTDRRVVHVAAMRFEAPNWLHDGKTLIVNSGGRILAIPATGGEPRPIDTGFATRCNNDHGVSPDGATLVISDHSQGDHKSRIYTLPVAGGTPQLVTPEGPSYWHGWSPDGRTLAYCAQRGGEFDIYTIPAAGGPETRLTTAKGLDDGPEYAPDGRRIYFNSERSGRMQIWRMNVDGSGQEPVTDDDFNNWFPHPSPDGRSLVFLSFEKDVVGHPEDKDVTLRKLTLEGDKIDVLGRFFGGQGTLNVPCWSPDGRKIAFVTYQLVP
ncbi:cellulase family glycosylhydrolase [Paludisphaera mucosa]|uniref:Cellulase family glycosylhydrolase n=1 Tax=Paludisphaera mucosa TaxID=3030827 RepID=A0ABT6FGW1_9BACT|nr:cellulase family glycosylhydrolase [Paludisphaera mucosa]MDG3006628.1 cellulase family glycosylhydrolase [Paludisphaera mucosa]